MSDPRKMPRARLGRDGPAVSRLGLGLAALGRPGYITLGHGADLTGGTTPEAMRDNAWAVLDAAYAAGVRYVDAARSYGRAEEFLAGWLRERRIGDVVVGSKWGYTYTAEWAIDAPVHEVKDHSAEVFSRQLVQSLDHLGDHLHLYQVHSATRDSGILDDRIVLSGLAALRDQGTLIGLTTSGPSQAETIYRALEIESGGRRVFGAVQATWNLLETSASDALKTAHDAGLAVIVKEALANGRLTSRGDLPDALARGGQSPDQIALGAALAQPWADVVLLGPTTTDQLASNLGAVGVDAGALQGLRGLAGDPNDYWATRAGLSWN